MEYKRYVSDINKCSINSYSLRLFTLIFHCCERGHKEWHELQKSTEQAKTNRKNICKFKFVKEFRRFRSPFDSLDVYVIFCILLLTITQHILILFNHFIAIYEYEFLILATEIGIASPTTTSERIITNKTNETKTKRETDQAL